MTPIPFMNRWRLSTRIVTQSLGLLLIVQIASFAVIRTGIERNARLDLGRELVQGERIWSRLIEQRAQKLQQGAALLAADFGFRSAVASGDVDTLGSVLDNHGARIGASFAALLDTRQGIRAQSASNPKAAAATLHSLSAELSQHGEAVAMVEGKAYQFVMVPLKVPVLMGWVVMGFALDKDVLDEMRTVTGQHVLLVSPSPALASRFSGRQVLLSTLTRQEEAQAMAQPFTGEDWMLNQEVYMARQVPVDNHGQVPAPVRVDAVLLGSVSQAVAPYRSMQFILAFITVGGLLLFAIGSWLTARRVVQPLLDLVQASDRLAQGHYNEPPTHTNRLDEVGDLAKAFDHMRLSIADQQHEIRQLAFWDRLTGLPNRVQFRDTVLTALAHAQAQRAPAPIAVLMLDLDRFKHVNDVLGYAVGDRLLQAVAERLKQAVPDPQYLARMGGDEFALMVPNCTPQQALALAQALLVVFEHPLVIDEQTIDLAAGVGIACWPEHATDADVLLGRAEIAMYAAKRDTHVPLVYDPQQDAGSAKTLSLMSELKQALEKNELRLYLQPKIDLATRNVVGAEALVRWQHSTRGLVPPMAFIPFAEQTGFIRKLTLWIFEACAREQAALAQVGVGRVSVNLSTRDLLDQELPEKFDALLRNHASTAKGFCLEITESAIMDDPQRAEATLNRLSSAGFKLSIDDFGTGYSSLAYLKRLPVNELKIDQSFVKAMATSTGDTKIVRSTIDLAHNLGLQVVAEGVETEDIAQALAGMSCDEAQGYFYCKPIPVNEFLAWVVQWQAKQLALANQPCETAQA
jgi:diguanylate cyclase (GGDEF)-like protein